MTIDFLEKAHQIATIAHQGQIDKTLKYGYYLFDANADFGTLFAWDEITKEYLRFSRIKLPKNPKIVRDISFLESYKLVGTEQVFIKSRS